MGHDMTAMETDTAMLKSASPFDGEVLEREQLGNPS
jgi:hypothetical protein